MNGFRQKLITGAQTAGLSLDETLTKALALHWQRLLEANTRFNLTAITNEDAATDKHYLDCLLAGEAIAPLINAGDTVADIGSGGGFPGLILAAARPELYVTLIESSRKKAEFLEECAAALGIVDLAVFSCRAEDAGRQPDLRGSFSAVTARAVSELSVLAEYALPLLAPNGVFFAMKGPCPREETEKAAGALDLLGGVVEETRYYTLPFSREKRSVVILRKTAPTPDKYPRRPGIPVKRPL